MRTTNKTQDKLISDYGDGPNLLDAAITGLSETDLDLALDAKSWTIREIVHHLADGDALWASFIKQAIGHPNGEFILQWYWQIPQDGWAEKWNYRGRAIGPSLALFRASRGHIVQLLDNLDGGLGKSLRICWPKGEEEMVSVGWVLEMQIRHVELHIADIRKIMAANDL